MTGVLQHHLAQHLCQKRKEDTLCPSLSLIALTRVRDADSGLASSLLNIGQQIGGAIGLAALGTVTWTVAANNLRSHAGAVSTATARSVASDALAVGVARGFLVAAGLALAALVIAVLTTQAEPKSDRHPVAATTSFAQERSRADA